MTVTRSVARSDNDRYRHGNFPRSKGGAGGYFSSPQIPDVTCATVFPELPKLPPDISEIKCVLQRAHASDFVSSLINLIQMFDRGMSAATQKFIFQQIINGSFGDHPEVLSALAESMGEALLAWVQASGERHINNRGIQQVLAMAVKLGKFSGDEVLLKICRLIERMQPIDPKAQRLLMEALVDGIFSHNVQVLEWLLIRIDGKITDPEAQRLFISALRERQFSQSRVLLGNAADIIRRMNIVEPSVERAFTCAVMQGVFGTDVGVLFQLSKIFARVQINDQYAQEYLMDALCNGKFGDNSVVLVTILTHMSRMNIAAPAVQQLLITAIKNRVFLDHDVVVAVIHLISRVNITDPQLQRELTLAIDEGLFGDDVEVYKQLLILIENMNIVDPQAQESIVVAMCSGRLGVIPDGFVMYLISRWIITSVTHYDSLCRLLNIQSCLPHPFGVVVSGRRDADLNGHYNYGGDTERRNYPNEVNNINVTDCFGNSITSSWSGSFGVAYDTRGKPRFLLVYEESIPDGDDGTQQDSTFQSFINPQNVSNLSKLRVFRLPDPVVDTTETQYPRLVELVEGCDCFNDLPPWLQARIKQNNFNPEHYQSAAIIRHVMNFIPAQVPTLSADAVMNQQCQNIIGAVIKARGYAVSIFNDSNREKQFKDLLNHALCGDQFECDESLLNRYTQYVDVLWQGFMGRSEEQLKLVFLLAHLAKRGALGYHIGEENLSNIVFYKLSRHYFGKFMASGHLQLLSSAKIETLNNMQRHLAGGYCIEIFASNLETVFPHVATVWDRVIS